MIKISALKLYSFHIVLNISHLYTILSELRSDRIQKLVEIVSYCLLPNHYHFILKQVEDSGIPTFMHKLGTGYTNYFNLKNDRNGALFQGPFKAVPVETDEQLLYLSAYINGNAEIHKVASACDWKWSSYQEYFSGNGGSLCNRRPVMDQFGELDEYKKYIDTVISETRKRKDEMKDYVLEENSIGAKLR